VDPATIGALGSAGGDIAGALGGGPEVSSETNNKIVNKGPNVDSKVKGSKSKNTFKRIKVGKGANVVFNLGEPEDAFTAAEPAAAQGGSSTLTIVIVVIALALLLLLLAAKFL
jgi:hypothetical protein